MVNEKVTDFFVGGLLKEANINFVPNGSNIKEIDEALKTASKKGTDSVGFPEFTCKVNDFILVIEDKADINKQAKYCEKNNNKLDMNTEAVVNYAENGALHKFQGREKDAIIISSVDNKISEFVDDPNLLNVAVSRAKKYLAVVISNNEENWVTNFGYLKRYIEYNNLEIKYSKISSVFDLLYKNKEKEKLEYIKKHKIEDSSIAESLLCQKKTKLLN